MRNLKKVIALVAVFAMLVSTVAFASFTDVAATDNYVEAIETLSALGIITGDDEDGDGKMEFRPEDTITRAEVATLISRIQGLGEVKQTETVFNDVPSTHWASGYIAQAEGQKIVNGYGDGNFGPEDAVKYEEVIKMVMETIGYYPFAAENGGYPSGYTLAAQRYGVLDGVVGGSVGAPAPRGMVAQILFNAIDTPIMDKATWGANGEYVIYDDIDGDFGFMTLLSRDLNMVKVTGVVVANSFTDIINGGVDVQAEDEKSLVIKLEQTDSNYQYLEFADYDDVDGYLFGDSEDLFQGAFDADSTLGHPVVAYAKNIKNGREYELAAIVDGGIANSMTITLDQYEDIETGDSAYKLVYNEDGSSKDQKTGKIDNDACVIYNGVGQGNDKADIEAWFGGVITADSEYSGQITLIKTGASANYDIVSIEIGASAVVDELDGRGKLTFQDAPQVPYVKNHSAATSKGLSSIKFEEDDEDYLVTLTQNGEEYDYTTLKEWDVVTVIWDGQHDVYSIVVLGADNYVDGVVSSVSGDEYKIGDAWYELAITDTVTAGDSGRFYVDAYGKVVAWDKTVEVAGAGAGARGAYAYVLNAQYEKDSWGKPNVRVQILDKTGDIYEAYLASQTTLYNFDEDYNDVLDGLGKKGEDRATIDFTKLGESDKAKVVALADALVNNMVTYSASNAGDIKTITMPSDDEDAKFSWVAQDNDEFDAETMELGKVVIGADTYVFLVDAPDYAGATLADDDNCSVQVGYALDNKVAYDYVAFDVDNSDVAGAVVILNYDASAFKSTNIAVINRVGESYDGVNDVYEVEYYMNGELFTAVTDGDVDTAALENAKRGDVYKLNVANGVILDATELLTFAARTSDKQEYAYAEDVDATPVVNKDAALLATEDAIDDEDTQALFMGAVTKKVSAGKYEVALGTPDEDGILVFDNAEKIRVAAGDANVYVYDPNQRGDNALFVGSIADITVDEKLFNGEYTVEDEDGNDVATPAFGMADYVFVRQYDGDVMDIIIYKNYEFEYDTNVIKDKK